MSGAVLPCPEGETCETQCVHTRGVGGRASQSSKPPPRLLVFTFTHEAKARVAGRCTGSQPAHSVITRGTYSHPAYRFSNRCSFFQLRVSRQRQIHYCSSEHRTCAARLAARPARACRATCSNLLAVPSGVMCTEKGRDVASRGADMIIDHELCRSCPLILFVHSPRA